MTGVTPVLWRNTVCKTKEEVLQRDAWEQLSSEEHKGKGYGFVNAT